MSSTPPTQYSPFPPFVGWDEQYDGAAFGRYSDLLSEMKGTATPEALTEAVRIASRFAAVDTGAIEGLYQTDRGFTRTIAFEAASWEAVLDARGPQTRRSIEDALEGYEYVLDAAVGSVAISEAWIRQLHQILCRSQESYTVYTAVGPQDHELVAGQYKTQPNSPTNLETGKVHAYCPPEDTPVEMHRFVDELASEAFQQAHPVVQAAYAHYAFVCIHPFPDGNGRLARALASVWLYRSPGVPLVIFADQKTDYLDALEAADAGSNAPFIAFISTRAIDAIEIVRLHLRPRKAPSAAETFKRMRAVAVGRKGLTHEEMDAACARLLEVLTAELQLQVSQMDLPPGVKIQFGMASVTKIPAGYRAARLANNAVIITLSSNPPGQANLRDTVGVWAATAEHNGPDFMIASGMKLDALEILVDEIQPTATAVLGLKLTAWVEQELDVGVAKLADAQADALKTKGYL